MSGMYVYRSLSCAAHRVGYKGINSILRTMLSASQTPWLCEAISNLTNMLLIPLLYKGLITVTVVQQWALRMMTTTDGDDRSIDLYLCLHRRSCGINEEVMTYGSIS